MDLEEVKEAQSLSFLFKNRQQTGVLSTLPIFAHFVKNFCTRRKSKVVSYVVLAKFAVL